MTNGVIGWETLQTGKKHAKNLNVIGGELRVNARSANDMLITLADSSGNTVELIISEYAIVLDSLRNKIDAFGYGDTVNVIADSTCKYLLGVQVVSCSSSAGTMLPL